jgi:hypothetical protein
MTRKLNRHTLWRKRGKRKRNERQKRGIEVKRQNKDKKGAGGVNFGIGWEKKYHLQRGGGGLVSDRFIEPS